MKHWLAACFLLGATVSLTGCYYDPGYSYVRGNHYAGDAYYGQAAPVYNDGYYAPGYDGYYDGYYGCCYGPDVTIGIGGGWYGGRHYYRGGRDYYRGHAYRGWWLRWLSRFLPRLGRACAGTSVARSKPWQLPEWRPRQSSPPLSG